MSVFWAVSVYFFISEALPVCIVGGREQHKRWRVKVCRITAYPQSYKLYAFPFELTATFTHFQFSASVSVPCVTEKSISPDTVADMKPLTGRSACVPSIVANYLLTPLSQVSCNSNRCRYSPAHPATCGQCQTTCSQWYVACAKQSTRELKVSRLKPSQNVVTQTANNVCYHCSMAR